MTNEITCEEEEQNKISGALDEILEILKKYHLRTQDLVTLLANLGYSIGSSIDNIQGEGPDLETLQKLYQEQPTIGTALMLQSILTMTWIEEYRKK